MIAELPRIRQCQTRSIRPAGRYKVVEGDRAIRKQDRQVNLGVSGA